MGGHHYQYGYDINGNRTSVKVDGTTTQTLTVNTASNQLTTAGYGYDAAGNLTSDPSAGSLTYNKAGQMDTRGSGTTYAYAGTGQSELTHEVSPPMGTTWDYSYGLTSPQGVPVLSSVTKNGATAYLTNDPTTGIASEMHLATGQDDFYATDGHGSVVALLSQDSGGTLLATYTYDPYGVTTAITNIAGTTATTAINTNPYGYTFGTVDPSTSWVHHGARYHDTTTGRWTTTDPITTLNDPTRANPYSYAGDNPINFVDPTGRLTSLEILVIVFANIGLISATVTLFTLAPEASLFLALGAALGFDAAIGGEVLAFACPYIDAC